MDVIRRLQDGLHIRNAGKPRRIVGRKRHDAPQAGHATSLEVEDMGLPSEDDPLAAAAVRQKRDQIALRAGSDVEGRLLTQEPGGLLLEAQHRRVVSVDVVADLRLRHRPPHRRAGLRHRIAPQIYGKQRTHLQTALPKFALLTLFHFQII